METMRNSSGTISLMSPIDLQEGVASLSRGAYFKEASLSMTLSILTESAAQMSGIERVSIWALVEGKHELRCLELFERGATKHSSGIVLQASECPIYFQSLAGRRRSATEDALLLPEMSELAAGYLAPHKVTARLDTPIHIRGELQGVLSFEQVGSHLPWTTAHRLFAHAVANLVTLALVEYEAEEARREAKTATERLRAVFDASRDALLLADGESGIILDANRQAEKLFGCKRHDLVGKDQRMLHPKASALKIDDHFRQMASGQFRGAVLTEIYRSDGSVLPVEITSEIANTSDGKRLALGIFRPI
ncbi:MAG: PAS domain S-box protein [Azonexus sp.]|nr:PAS domain S-box protein [Azonexus sp.]MDZ4316823.1 PAS domain S-box protein [Azonexus sp.]